MQQRELQDVVERRVVATSSGLPKAIKPTAINIEKKKFLLELKKCGIQNEIQSLLILKNCRPWLFRSECGLNNTLGNLRLGLSMSVSARTVQCPSPMRENCAMTLLTNLSHKNIHPKQASNPGADHKPTRKNLKEWHRPPTKKNVTSLAKWFIYFIFIYKYKYFYRYRHRSVH